APAWLAGLALAFVLPGLAGHDPWKSLDALGIGIVYDMALGGDLLVPHVASWVWLNDAPLYYWVALAFGKLFQHFVEFHSAARLASGAFLLAACWLLYRAARDWTPPEARGTAAAAALLVFIGSVGLIVHAHEALPELASLAALSGALAVLPRAAMRPVATGALFGAATAFGRAAAFRAGVRLARRPARRGVHGAGAGRQPARAARAARAARFARRADAAAGGRRGARLVRGHHLRLLRRADLAGVHGDDDRRAAQGGRQLRPRRAWVHAAIQPALLPFRGRADARLVLHRAVRRARAAAQRGA